MDSDSDYEADIPHFPRDLPNILITGTPGTGKTTTSEMAAEATGLTHINVGDLVKAKSLHEGLDTEYDSYILDEDKVPFRLILSSSSFYLSTCHYST